jgi:hypothetical protein
LAVDSQEKSQEQQEGSVLGAKMHYLLLSEVAGSVLKFTLIILRMRRDSSSQLPTLFLNLLQETLVFAGTFCPKHCSFFQANEMKSGGED